ncbi:MAG: peptidase U32 family protein [Methanobacterium sp.]
MIQAAQNSWKIIAPVNQLAEVEILATAGVDEIYCGILPDDWISKYGDWDTLNRRQGQGANLASANDLSALAQAANEHGIPAALALNVRYTSSQLTRVIEYAKIWDQSGGAAIIVSDLGLLNALRQSDLHVKLHLSLLAGVFNSRAAKFYQQFGVSRIILPRSLSIAEMKEITAGCQGLDFEAMVLNDKCQFIDAYCGFYHGKCYPPGIGSYFHYAQSPEGDWETFSHDLHYAGHACQLPFTTDQGLAPSMCKDDFNCPHCAACYLNDLSNAGVACFKLGGRGFPTEFKLQGISYIRECISFNKSEIESQTEALYDAYHRKCIESYKKHYGAFCSPDRCYYNRD